MESGQDRTGQKNILLSCPFSTRLYKQIINKSLPCAHPDPGSNCIALRRKKNPLIFYPNCVILLNIRRLFILTLLLLRLPRDLSEW